MSSATNAPPRTEPRRDRTVALAHAAITSMLEHDIPPSPPCFAVWFDYHAGTTSTVRRLIDTYLTNRRGLSEAVVHAIHERFFDTSRESAALMQTARRLREATEQVVGLVATMGGDTQRFGHALEGYRVDLQAGEGGLARALAGLIEETRDMAERSAEIGARLEASALVINDLQAQLQQALVEARTDALTGLPNRRAVDAVAAALVEDARATGRPLPCVLLDIDRFKLVNDTWGHPVGDAVLRRVAGSLAGALAEAEPCGRLGGEEFVVLLPGQELPAAVRTAERLRAAVAAQEFAVRATGRVLGSVTLSAGVAMLRPGEAWPGLLGRADAALYRAKQEGRNRVCWDDGSGYG